MYVFHPMLERARMKWELDLPEEHEDLKEPPQGHLEKDIVEQHTWRYIHRETRTEYIPGNLRLLYMCRILLIVICGTYNR